ncbi:MAG TPA: shikimate kinase [Terriglobales bacterium]|nr:shikimate kinase [Terriglobales bacterium]
MNLYLCGMIGSGKTAIGERLAARLGRPFFDLDAEMDREIGASFHELVREHGWLPFRELEYAICKRFAALHESVCALGGGTVRYEWNRDALRGTGLTVLLEADLAVLAERVRRADRPRVNPGVTLEEDLARLWTSAESLYRKAADLTYRTDTGLDVDAEVDDLARLLKERGL